MTSVFLCILCYSYDVSLKSKEEIWMYPNRIRELRIEKGITQIKLSIDLGVTQETISAYETGKNLPSTANLLKLSKILSASTDYILMLSPIRTPIDTSTMMNDERRLLTYYRMLGGVQKEKALSYLQGLCDSNTLIRR